MIRIAVIDDEAEAREKIVECLSYVSEREETELSVSEFSSGLAFLGNYSPIYDIILMDIEMPGENGLEVARMLRETDKSVLLIFVTNMAQYAVSGYEVDALDFIVKPVNRYTLAMKMKRAIARTAKRLDDAVQIKSEGELYTIRASSVKYVESDGHYVIYHTAEGNFSEYGTLKIAENKLGKRCFVRCNRCYLVNLRYVDAVKRDCAVIGGEELLISRPQKKAFLSAFSKFLGGEK